MTKQARDKYVNPMGRANANPFLDSSQYVVKFENGTEADLAANAIYKTFYAHCDPVGN